MTKTGHRMLTLLALLTLGVTARAQDAPPRETSKIAGPAVTISVTERGVRFAALGSFGKLPWKYSMRMARRFIIRISGPPACAIGSLTIRKDNEWLTAPIYV